jgi:hypothetical protein
MSVGTRPGLFRARLPPETRGSAAGQRVERWKKKTRRPEPNVHAREHGSFGSAKKTLPRLLRTRQSGECPRNSSGFFLIANFNGGSAKTHFTAKIAKSTKVSFLVLFLFRQGPVVRRRKIKRKIRKYLVRLRLPRYELFGSRAFAECMVHWFRLPRHQWRLSVSKELA